MKTDEQKKKDIQKIHIGAKQLGLSKHDGNEEKGIMSTYHAMLWTIASVKSSLDLDDYGRRKVLKYMRDCGVKFTKQGKRRPTPAKSKEDLIGKVRAQLAEAKKPDNYADDIARNMYKVERYEWCTAEQLAGIIAALYRNAKRKGLKTR